eukprot:snap_masked-scaffold_23-processed-gene-5.46-mRNA-1 protein AED:0.32 eAED:0.32 QI:0/-1/0/1/-1/1/1/0/305
MGNNSSNGSNSSNRSPPQRNSGAQRGGTNSNSRSNRDPRGNRTTQTNGRRPVMMRIGRDGRQTYVNGNMVNSLLARLEDAQLNYALEMSRRDFQQEPKGPPPVEKKLLSQLKESCLDLADIEEGNEQCVVCCEEQKVGDLGIKLPCFHCFHKDCIIPWLKRHNTCPVCRVPLTEESYKKLESNLIERRKQKRKDKENELEAQRKKLGLDEINKRDFEPENMKVKDLKWLLEKLGLKKEVESILEKNELVSLVKKEKEKTDFENFSIDTLKQRLNNLHVDFGTVTEKKDLRKLLSKEVDRVFSIYN